MVSLPVDHLAFYMPFSAYNVLPPEVSLLNVTCKATLVGQMISLNTNSAASGHICLPKMPRNLQMSWRHSAEEVDVAPSAAQEGPSNPSANGSIKTGKKLKMEIVRPEALLILTPTFCTNAASREVSADARRLLDSLLNESPGDYVIVQNCPMKISAISQTISLCQEDEKVCACWI